LRRIVFDPGVLIAALISAEGPPAEALDRWREGEFDLVVSPALLAELERVLLRRKFRPCVSEGDVRQYVAALAQEGVVISDPPPSSEPLTEDPKDDYVLSLARAAVAEAIVSGDAHLTGLRAAEPPVLTPRQFLAELGERT
jgi:putative PIN family toxin of toxin-antitoxin system